MQGPFTIPTLEAVHLTEGETWNDSSAKGDRKEFYLYTYITFIHRRKVLGKQKIIKKILINSKLQTNFIYSVFI